MCTQGPLNHEQLAKLLTIRRLNQDWLQYIEQSTDLRLSAVHRSVAKGRMNGVAYRLSKTNPYFQDPVLWEKGLVWAAPGGDIVAITRQGETYLNECLRVAADYPKQS